MPRGIPKKALDAPQPPPNDLEKEKLLKELEEAKAKLAELSKPAPEPVVETQPEPEAPVRAATIDKKIPVVTMPGRAIDVTEHGYDFENVHLRRDVPLNVLSEMFVHRVGDHKKGEDIRESFFTTQSMINLYAARHIKKRMRVMNGVVEHGSDSYPVPLINPEVILRVLEDRMKSDRNFKSFFAGVKEVNLAKAFGAIQKTYPLLA